MLKKAASTLLLSAGLLFSVPFYAGSAAITADQIRHWTLRAEQGSAYHQALLGDLYSIGVSVQNGASLEQDPRKAVEWYRKAAEQGHADAQFSLGLSYTDGTGVQKDPYKAVEWYRKAAEQGQADAQFMLGICCANGTGMQKDPYKAVEWFRKAAEQGQPLALFQLGESYEYGNGVPKDMLTAMEWYGKACDNKNQKGCDAYARLYDACTPPPHPGR